MSGSLHLDRKGTYTHLHYLNRIGCLLPPKYWHLQKLEKFKSPAYEDSIKNVLGVGISDIVTALAFAGDNPSQIDIKTGQRDPDLIFNVLIEVVNDDLVSVLIEIA